MIEAAERKDINDMIKKATALSEIAKQLQQTLQKYTKTPIFFIGDIFLFRQEQTEVLHLRTDSQNPFSFRKAQQTDDPEERKKILEVADELKKAVFDVIAAAKQYAQVSSLTLPLTLSLFLFLSMLTLFHRIQLPRIWKSSKKHNEDFKKSFKKQEASKPLQVFKISSSLFVFVLSIYFLWKKFISFDPYESTAGFERRQPFVPLSSNTINPFDLEPSPDDHPLVAAAKEQARAALDVIYSFIEFNSIISEEV